MLEVEYLGNRVGEIENPHSDMWYLEGKWIGTERSDGLVIECNNLDTKQCIKTGTGVDVILIDNGQRITALIMAPIADTIFLRLLTSKTNEQ